MTRPKLLIANRGEIAIRIAQAAAELDLPTVGVYAEDDGENLHVRRVDEAQALAGSGPAAYLDGEQIVKIARENGCTLIHPGYGFLSEKGDFARSCAAAGLIFVGPRPELLDLFGDKTAARRQARALDLPLIPGSDQATTLEEAAAFLGEHPQGMVIKAVAGGGGRGMRIVRQAADLPALWERCRSEAEGAFGQGELFVEKWLPQVRHIEIQIAGDGKRVVDFGERDCSLQRRHQKVMEIAPAPGLPAGLRQKMIEAAVKLAGAVKFDNLGTVEFLVEGPELKDESRFYFIEVNPRLQVEHTITEEVFGVDLVQLQLRLALGATFADLNLTQKEIGPPRGQAVQLRINAETIDENGDPRPQAGRISSFELPHGRGVRIDTHGYTGFQVSPRYDSLLAKVVCHTQTADWPALLRLAARALSEIDIQGVGSTVLILRGIVREPMVEAGLLDTRMWQKFNFSKKLNFSDDGSASDEKLNFSKKFNFLEGEAVRAPAAGTVIEIQTAVGATVRQGDALVILEAMKMEAVIASPAAGYVNRILVETGDIVADGDPLLIVEVLPDDQPIKNDDDQIDLDHLRPDLDEVFARRAYLLDEKRPEAVARRHAKGQRTARENVADLCDPDTFVEYGSAIVAAQRTRRSLDDLMRRTPADGLITGYGSVNGELFSAEDARCLVMAYDYTVLAGTQGALNHKKMDRMLRLAHRWRRPLVIFAEGGGGRPGDVDYMGAAQLDVMTFTSFAGLSGKMPLVSVVSGYCFAGNAALAGCADVIIATGNSSLGMGGPAMIEGGGLGVFHPSDVGPAAVQWANGVIDILAADEGEAVAAARRYLSYFQGPVERWACADQRRLRHLIPENRRRVYSVREVLETLADEGSVLELRGGFGKGMITALVRIEGRPVGVIANNPLHLGGAIDSEGAQKAVRFMTLCDTFGLPILALVDTPGIMVGPEAEKSGTVRHASQMFVAAVGLTVPYFAVVLRKGYGLGAQAMCGGSFHVPVFTVSWPTGEFGPMGLEGAVKLGFRRELERIEDPAERQAAYERMVAEAYEQGKALNVASFMEIDEVIDPAETRGWLAAGLLVLSK